MLNHFVKRCRAVTTNFLRTAQSQRQQRPNIPLAHPGNWVNTLSLYFPLAFSFCLAACSFFPCSSLSHGYLDTAHMFSFPPSSWFCPPPLLTDCLILSPLFPFFLGYLNNQPLSQPSLQAMLFNFRLPTFFLRISRSTFSCSPVISRVAG